MKGFAGALEQLLQILAEIVIFLIPEEIPGFFLSVRYSLSLYF